MRKTAQSPDQAKVGFRRRLILAVILALLALLGIQAAAQKISLNAPATFPVDI